MEIPLKKFILSLVILLFTSTTIWSADQQVIKTIEVVGNQRLEKKTIISFINLNTGDTLTEEASHGVVKKLFSTEYFKDVSLTYKDGVLIIKVVENPTISRVVFEGNRSVTDKILSTGMKIKARMLLNQPLIQEELQRVLAIYRMKGYFASKVNPQIIKLDQNRVDLIFDIHEGEPTKIEAINFIGNNSYSDWDLASILSTKETIWWKFFSTDDIYDPDKIEMDKEELRKFYLNKGYADFKVMSVDAELTPSFESFIITFHVSEGERYKFGSLKVDNKIAALNEQELKSLLTVDEGDWYSAVEVENSVEAMTNEIGRKGLAFIKVKPIPTVDSAKRLINITFEVIEGPKVFIDKINIRGNTRTIDKVIRREFTLAEGDAFNASKLRTSERMLNNLGFFKKVDLKKGEIPGHSDRVNINLDVEEQSTGDFNFGGGFSTTEGPLGMVSVTERNLFGRAYELGSRLQIAKRSKNINVDFMNPAFLERKLVAGVGLFANKTDREDVSSYSQRSYGSRFWSGYYLAPHLSQTWSYTIANTRIQGVKATAFSLIRDQRGSYVTSAIGHDISYDRRDNRFAPTKGYIVILSNEYAGVGGNVQYLRNTLSGAAYRPLTEHIILGIDAQIGVLNKMGKPLRISDKFMLGGESLRGFDYNGVGPHGIGVENDSLGGNVMFVTSAEVSFPLGFPKDFAISGHVFIDAGTLWDTYLKRDVNAYNQKNPTAPISVYNLKGMRAAAGLGVSWASPMGVISLDYAKIIKKQNGDEAKALLVRFGSGKF